MAGGRVENPRGIIGFFAGLVVNGRGRVAGRDNGACWRWGLQVAAGNLRALQWGYAVDRRKS